VFKADREFVRTAYQTLLPTCAAIEKPDPRSGFLCFPGKSTAVCHRGVRRVCRKLALPMKDHTHRLLAVLKNDKASNEFKSQARKLLEETLWPGWCRLPDKGKDESIPLTIGMATFDDYDGVYFSLQALRLYHPEILDQVEFVVIDNQPESDSGKAVARLVNGIENATYVPFTIRSGTAVRDAVFKFARGRFVLCMDCHVFFPPGSVKKLLDFIEANPDCPDLLQGPLLRDDLSDYSTHLEDRWHSCFWGQWGTDERAEDPNSEPFEIPMQGLGSFCCRRESWPGFNPRTKGFGGEEGSLHQIFRNRGDKTLCLPFLLWLHRFERPAGAPYSNRIEERVRNYLLLFSDCGLDWDPVYEHFSTKMDEDALKKVLEDVRAEQAHPSYRYDMLFLLLQDCTQPESLKHHRLFGRCAVRSLGRSERYPGLAFFGAIREICREACRLDLQEWCVIWAQDLDASELEARVELLEHLACPGVWDGLSTFRLSPRMELWKFHRTAGEALLRETSAEMLHWEKDGWTQAPCQQIAELLERSKPLCAEVSKPS
jgi:hypothetical protein